MKEINPISEKSQKAIVNTIEKFMPDKDKSLPATEIITHFVAALGEEADENAIVNHLAQNTDKSFQSDELKVIAGKFGVEEYKSHFEAEKKTTEPEKKGIKTPIDVNYDRDPTENTASQKAKQLPPELKVVHENLKADWIAKNKDLLKGLSAEDANKLADKVIYESIMEAQKRHGKSTPITGQDNGQPNEQQAQRNGQTLQKPSVSYEANAILDIAKGAFKIASAVAAGAVGATAGIGKGLLNVSKKPTTDSNEPEFNDMQEIKHAKVESNYATKVLQDSSERLSNKTAELNLTLDEFKANSTDGDLLQKNSMLNKISKQLNELKGLKDIVKSDTHRNGVDEDAKFNAIKELNNVKDTMGKVDKNLGNSEREKEVKSTAESISRAIDRVIKAIKNIFSKEKDNDLGQDNDVDSPSLSR